MNTRGTPANRLRQQLCALLRTVGPSAPTLCRGWNTSDLAAHLVIRESRPDAAAGIVLPFLAGRTSRIQAEYAALPWEALVNRVLSGPPAWSPLRWFDSAANLIEFAIHYEDVRGANPGAGSPAIDDQIQTLLWRRLRAAAPLMFRHVPASVTLSTPDGRSLTVNRRRGHTITLTGSPSDLLLQATGRPSDARISGDAPDIEAYERSNRSI